MENSLPLEDENTNIFENEKENLICVSREHVRKLEDQQQQIVILGARLAAKVEDIEACLQDKENAVQTARKKDIVIENLQKDISMLKMECRRREIEAANNARFNVERGFMEEKQMFLKFIDEKEQTVTNLKELATSLERELTSTVISSFTDIVEKQVKIDALTDALDRRKCVTDKEIEEKNKLVLHLEEELCSLHRRLTQQEECFLSLKQEAEQLQALMETKILETENLMDEQRRMAGIIKQLEFNKGVLVRDSMKLLIERENLLAYIQKVCDHIGKFSSEDAEMMKVLGKMLPRPEEETEPAADLTRHDEFCNSTTGENSDTSLLATTKKLEASSDERSPLKEVN